jgi:hypothetical protein
VTVPTTTIVLGFLPFSGSPSFAMRERLSGGPGRHNHACKLAVQRPTMRGEAPWTRLRLTRDMNSRRRTTLLNGLSVPDLC